MEYVLQRPEEAYYALFRDEEARKFDPSLLTVLDRAEIENDDLKLEVAIIGESHYMRVWLRGTLLLAEMLACVDPSTMPAVAQFNVPLTRDHLPVNLSLVGDTNQFCFSVVFQEERPLDHEAQSSTHGVVQYVELRKVFPGYGSPFTRVCATLESNLVAVNTVHSYPDFDEGKTTYIVSSTRLKFVLTEHE